MSFWVAGRPLPEPVPRGRMPRITTLVAGMPFRSSPTSSLILRARRELVERVSGWGVGCVCGGGGWG